MMANGTKVMRATSFVIHMEVKKQSIIKIKHKDLVLPVLFSSFSESRRKKPVLSRPATTAMRQNKRLNTRKSI